MLLSVSLGHKNSTVEVPSSFSVGVLELVLPLSVRPPGVMKTAYLMG